MVFQCDVHANVECITQRGLVYTSQYSHHVYISLILSPWRATGIWLLLIQLLASIALSSPLHHVSLDVPVSISLSCYNMQHRTQHSWGVSCKMQLEKKYLHWAGHWMSGVAHCLHTHAGQSYSEPGVGITCPAPLWVTNAVQSKKQHTNTHKAKPWMETHISLCNARVASDHTEIPQLHFLALVILTTTGHFHLVFPHVGLQVHSRHLTEAPAAGGFYT